MHPKSIIDRSSAFILAMASLSACATMDPKKATSVVDPERIDAVQELAQWKQQADTSARVAPPGCEPKYATAQQQVNGWIEGPLRLQIDDTAAQYYGTVDLSRQQIPARVSAAVGEFRTCVADVGE